MEALGRYRNVSFLAEGNEILTATTEPRGQSCGLPLDWSPEQYFESRLSSANACLNVSFKDAVVPKTPATPSTPTDAALNALRRQLCFWGVESRCVPAMLAGINMRNL